MNKFVKNLVVGITSATVIASSFSLGFADSPIIIHERSNVENISSGVVHEHIQRFTYQGWWNINVLRVDLTDRYTEIGALFSDKGIATRDKLTNMMKSSNAIAGINGDFFSSSGYSYPVGTVVSDGKMVASPFNTAFNPSKNLPVFSIDEDNNPFISYWLWDIKVLPEKGLPLSVTSINKPSSAYGEIRMFDKDWGATTFGNKLFTDMVEVIIEDDEVIDIRMGQEPVDMPEDGYILVGRGGAKDSLINNFRVGDEVELQINTQPNVENLKSAIGGGAYLVKDGRINTSSLDIDITGNQPRTALGITRDRKELIMVTLDGRHSSFNGVSQQVMAQIMIDLGAYEALNFDGGGSTTMAVSMPGEENPSIVNHPSDGVERSVINGVGVFNNAPQKTLNYINVLTDDTNVFANTTRKFYIRGYDKYHNPVEVDLDRVDFHLEGIEGDFKGNVLTAKDIGVGTVVAEYKGKTAKLDIRVLSPARDIEIEEEKIHIDFDSQKSLGEIYGINNEGYTAKIEPTDVSWDINGDIGVVKDGVLHSRNKPAAGAITASVGDAIENIIVSVGYTESMVESFESLDNLKFAPYPQEVKGSIELDEDDKLGSNSLKLSYDFTKTDETRAAYVLLGQSGITLQGRPDKLGLWVNGNESNHWLRGKLVDSKGNAYNIDFSTRIDWKDWKWVTAEIPSGVSYPLKLERVYLVEPNSVNKDKGEILLDGLKALYSTQFESMVLPGETTISDQLQRKSELKDGGYKFVVANGITNMDNLLKYQINNKITSTINSADLGIIMNGLNIKYHQKIDKPTVMVTSGYSVLSHKNTAFIQLDDTKNGLRSTNPEQWKLLKDRLERTTEKNIFVLLPRPVFGGDGFTDKLEAELLDEILAGYKTNGKNVWVVSGGTETKVELRSGIRYIEYNSQQINGNVDIFSLQKLEFTVNGDEITYEILPLFETK